MYRELLVSISALALVGCATPYRIPVSQETTQSVKATKAVVLLDQEEIVAEFEPARGGAAAGVAGVPGIGLFVAMAVAAAESAVIASVNAERAKEAEAQATPVRNALLDYNFRAGFQESITREFSGVSWMKLAGVKHDSPKTKLDDIKAATGENTVLLLNTRYSLTPGLRDLRIWSVAALMPNDPSLAAIATKERPGEDVPRLYRNEFVFTQPLPVVYENPEQAARAWSDNNGRFVRAALQQGVTEVARMMVMDMHVTDAANAPASAAAPVEIGKARGTVVTETAERAILRLENGTMHSVAKLGTQPTALLQPAASDTPRATTASAIKIEPASHNAGTFPRRLTGPEIQQHVAKLNKVEANRKDRPFTLKRVGDKSFERDCPSCNVRWDQGDLTVKSDEALVCLRFSRVTYPSSGCFQLVQTAGDSFAMQTPRGTTEIEYSLGR